jgi:hypothetical protein
MRAFPNRAKPGKRGTMLLSALLARSGDIPGHVRVGLTN